MTRSAGWVWRANMYELKTPQFSGPIEKLLELIEAKELDITRVSLSEVTADFLSYVRMLTDIDSRSLSDFLVVAARLVLIKSKALIPTLPLSEEEEEDIVDRERRLELYKEFKKASKHVELLWRSKAKLYARELFHSGDMRVFYPSKNLSLPALQSSLQNLLRILEKFAERHTETIKRTVVTLEHKMEELVKMLQGSQKSSKLSELAKNKEEVIVLFLAILHLIKDRLIDVQQKSQFDDIMIKSTNN